MKQASAQTSDSRCTRPAGCECATPAARAMCMHRKPDPANDHPPLKGN